MSISIVGIIAAFGAGILGSIIGGTLSFALTGIIALIGIAVTLGGGETIFTNAVAFGPFLGPHISFAGAVAGAAYAGRKKYIDGSDVNISLFAFKEPLLLLIGGTFGIVGYVLNQFLASIDFIANNFDTVATTVFLSAITARVLITGTAPLSDTKKQTLQTMDSDQVSDTSVEEVYGEESINGQKSYVYDIIWSFGMAVAVAFVTFETGINNVGWAVSAISLIFAFLGFEDFPVTHHITMVAGVAASTFIVIYSPTIAILLTGLFGVISVISGIWINNAINTNVDSHIDMPAIVIALWTFIILFFFG